MSDATCPYGTALPVCDYSEQRGHSLACPTAHHNWMRDALAGQVQNLRAALAQAEKELACFAISPENFIPELSATGAADLAALMAAPPRRIPALALACFAASLPAEPK